MALNGRSSVYTYRPPPQSNESFSQEMFKSLDRCSTLYDNDITFGDLNYDILSETKSRPLIDLMELFDYKNLIKGVTCFKKTLSVTYNMNRIVERCLMNVVYLSTCAFIRS